jgi:CubicO group peptidase (beta-lactamase class C family)
MSASGLSTVRLRRLREVLTRHVESGDMPGLVAMVARRGEVHVEAIGTLETGGSEPMRRDTIFRIASVTKQIAAAAAMTLVEECRLRLDDPVDGLLPELADRQVLTRIDAPLDDTVPAHRPITLRDLLTFVFGLGAFMAPPGQYPIQRALVEADLVPGAEGPPVEPDEWMKRLGALPLAYQPGEKWLYHTGSDVLGVLMARATGQPLAEVLGERVLRPLGMADTGFHVPRASMHRLSTLYSPDQETGALVLSDDPRHSLWRQPPAFPSAGGGLVSTADDLLAFCTMMLNKGRYGVARLLARPTVELMTTDLITEQQKAENTIFFGGNSGWGLGFQVFHQRKTIDSTPGRFGWTGGTGTSVYTDPAEELIGILLTQREMTSPTPPKVYRDFWTCVYQAIDD